MNEYERYRSYGHTRIVSAIHAVPTVLFVIAGGLIGWFVI